jgi:hypothetical protein
MRKKGANEKMPNCPIRNLTRIRTRDRQIRYQLLYLQKITCILFKVNIYYIPACQE